MACCHLHFCQWTQEITNSENFFWATNHHHTQLIHYCVPHALNVPNPLRSAWAQLRGKIACGKWKLWSRRTNDEWKPEKQESYKKWTAMKPRGRSHNFAQYVIWTHEWRDWIGSTNHHWKLTTHDIKFAHLNKIIHHWKSHMRLEFRMTWHWLDNIDIDWITWNWFHWLIHDWNDLWKY